METGVARTDVDLESYVEELEARLGKSREMMRVVLNKAKNDPKRVVLAEGDDEKMIRAAAQIVDQGIAEPVLIGDRDRITAIAETLGLDFAPEIVDPEEGDLAVYADRLYELRKRKGVTRHEAGNLVKDGNYLGSVMVETGDADAMLTGLTNHYPSALRGAAAGRRDRAGGRLRRRRLHADVQEPCRLLCRRDRQHRPRRGRPRRNHASHRRPGPPVQRRTARGDAVVL